jgi:hypothetical protein
MNISSHGRKMLAPLSAPISVLIPVMLMVASLCSAATHGGFRAYNHGTVTGRIVIDGVGPMMEGTVFFISDASGIPPSATKYWLVPGQAFRVDANAQFTAVLPEGTYYLGAIERSAGAFLGPPEDGDYFFISSDKNGEPRKLTVWKNSKIDLGTLSDAKRFSRATLAKEGITAIEGAIVNEDGKPVEGMVVFAYATPDMLGRPLYVSERSGKDGRYLLRLYRGGDYYLMTRADYGGGPPPPGELLGVYNEGEPVQVQSASTIKDIDIMAYKFY